MKQFYMYWCETISRMYCLAKKLECKTMNIVDNHWVKNLEMNLFEKKKKKSQGKGTIDNP